MQKIDLDGEYIKLIYEIYIKQHIRDGTGVLTTEFDDRKERVSGLISSGFIVKGRFYKFETLQCTETGIQMARKQIDQIINKEMQSMKGQIENIPPRLLDFFIYDCLGDRLYWPIEKRRYLFFDWRQIPLDDDRVWTQCLKLFTILEEYGLSIRTQNYVSTRGGEFRDKEFVFSPETITLLRQISLRKEGLTVEESKRFRLAYLLSDITPYITSATPPDVREFIWQKLNTNALTEADLAQSLNQLHNDRIVSEWRGLLSSKLPFEILDQTGFKIQLDSLLIKPSVEELFKFQRVVQYSSTIRSLIPVDDFLKKYEDLYVQIVTLEDALRKLIKQKLTAQFNGGWQGQIPSQIVEGWKRKEKDDNNESVEPEKELINYADFSDYAQIIGKFKKIFHDVFPDIERAVVELNRINNLGRKRVMHFRTISDEVYHIAMQSIRWVKDRLNSKV